MDDLTARGKPEVGAAQGFGGSDANVFHDRHGLDHRDVQWPHPLRRQVHHIAGHRGGRLRQKYRNPAILQRFEQVRDLPAVLDADECRLYAFSTLYTCKALSHALHHLILWETAQKGVLEPAHDAPPHIRVGDEAGDERDED